MQLGTALDLAGDLVAALREVRGVQEAAYAGSLRRMCETIGDLDLLVASSDPAGLMDALGALPHAPSAGVGAAGESDQHLADRQVAEVSRQGNGPMTRPAAGHRLLPHTADCIIEAWGPDVASCLTEALEALVAEFADVTNVAGDEVLPLRAGPERAQDLLVSLLEDVIYTVDVFSVVPVRFQLSEAADGAISGDMEVVHVEKVRITGPAPKAVSYHGLSMSVHEGGWRCRALIDV